MFGSRYPISSERLSWWDCSFYLFFSFLLCFPCSVIYPNLPICTVQYGAFVMFESVAFGRFSQVTDSLIERLKYELRNEDWPISRESQARDVGIHFRQLFARTLTGIQLWRRPRVVGIIPIRERLFIVCGRGDIGSSSV